MKQAIINRFKILSLNLPWSSKVKLFFWACLAPIVKKFGWSLPAFKIKYGNSPLFIGDGTDLGTFFEVFVFNEYDLKTDSTKIKRILDLGANSGYVSRFFAHKFPQAEIIAVEADPNNVAKIERNIAGLKENILIEPSAVSKSSGLIDFYLNFKTSISGSTINRDVSAQKISVPALTLADLEKKYGSFNVIKFDIEGGEWDAVLPETLAHFPEIWIGEYHEDLTGRPEADFILRFTGYQAVSKKIAKQRSLIVFKLI